MIQVASDVTPVASNATPVASYVTPVASNATPVTSDATSGIPRAATADAEGSQGTAVEVSELGPTYFLYTDASSLSKAVRILTVAVTNISLKIFIPDKDVSVSLMPLFFLRDPSPAAHWTV